MDAPQRTKSRHSSHNRSGPVVQDNEREALLDPLGFNQCQEAVKKLTEFLSHELRPEEEEEVQRHLRQCRGCFSKFHFEETLLRTIRERAEQVRAPGTLRHKILILLNRHDSNGIGPAADGTAEESAATTV